MLGHCRVVAKIGEGGMGIVYRAYDEVLHRDVAVKVVNKDLRLDSSASQSLLHEARASSSLAHPNICTVHEVGETDGELYIVMELVEGKSLRAMSTDAGLPPESVLRYGVQIASALARAHDRGIVHRDLKTANIVVTSHGLVKVLDCCLAKETIQRYQREGEVQAALEAVQSAGIVSTSPSADPGAPRTTVLHSVRHAQVRKGDFLLLLGTTKGAFILRSNAQRRRWEVGGPYFHGHSVYAMAYDNREGHHRIHP